MRFVVTPSPPHHLHEIVPVTWHVEFIPPSIFTNMFPPNLVCHDEMMASFAILLKKKVSYMKKQPDLFLNPIKHLLKKNTLIYNLTELLQHSLQRPKWDKKTCPPKTCPSVLNVATGSQITPYQVHNIWRDSKLTTPRLMYSNAATTATHSFRDELLSRCVFKQLPSYTAYKLYVLPPQCAVVAGFHPLLSSLHKKHHENLVANRASGGRLRQRF